VVALWDVRTQRLRDRLEVPADVWPPGFAFAPDGEGLVVARAGDVLWRNLATGQYRVLKKLGKRISALAFSPDGKLLAVGADGGAVMLWDVAAGQELATLQGKETVSGLAFSPDGKLLAAGDGRGRVPSYGVVHIWDVASRRLRASLPGHDNQVGDVAFSADGKTLASGGDDVRLWEVASGKPRATLTPGFGPIYQVKFCPGGRVLAVGGGLSSEHDDYSKPGKVAFYDAATWEHILTLEAHEASICSLAFSSDGKLMAVACSRDTVKVWDVSALTQGPARRGR
jgi:WD40 repeat protein